jgi:hypothetical protein
MAIQTKPAPATSSLPNHHHREPSQSSF